MDGTFVAAVVDDIAGIPVDTEVLLVDSSDGSRTITGPGGRAGLRAFALRDCAATSR